MWKEQEADTGSIARISEQWTAWYHPRIEFKRKKKIRGVAWRETRCELPPNKLVGEFLILFICILHIA